MRYLISIVILCFIYLGCNKKSNLEGDLYFKPLRLGSFYDKPDSLYQFYLRIKDSIGYNEIRKQNPQIIEQIELLESKGLLNSPYIYLKTDQDSVFIIYMNYSDYKGVLNYKYKDLINNKKKVRLKLSVNRLNPISYKCIKLIDLNEIDGETKLVEKKFKIEDYR